MHQVVFDSNSGLPNDIAITGYMVLKCRHLLKSKNRCKSHGEHVSSLIQPMQDHTTQINSVDNAEESSAQQPLITNDPNFKSYSAVETAENGATIASAADSESGKVIERRTWTWRSQSYKRSLAS